MKLILRRKIDTGFETLGKLFLEGKFLCYTLEDTYREKKIKHKTRIPAGLYKLALRAYGSHYLKYVRKFVDIFHKGMIQIMDVVGFTDILFHIGNSKEDTSGCILVGSDYREESGRIYLVSSTVAYKKVYPIIQKMIKYAEVELEIIDEEDLTVEEIDDLIRGVEEG
jgi:hypothetical protein